MPDIICVQKRNAFSQKKMTNSNSSGKFREFFFITEYLFTFSLFQIYILDAHANCYWNSGENWLIWLCMSKAGVDPSLCNYVIFLAHQIFIIFVPESLFSFCFVFLFRIEHKLSFEFSFFSFRILSVFSLFSSLYFRSIFWM